MRNKTQSSGLKFRALSAFKGTMTKWRYHDKMEVRGQNGGTMDKIEVPSQKWLKWRYHGQNGGTMNKMEVPLIKWRYNG